MITPHTIKAGGRGKGPTSFLPTQHTHIYVPTYSLSSSLMVILLIIIHVSIYYLVYLSALYAHTAAAAAPHMLSLFLYI